MCGQIILLHGPSGSGDSTTPKALLDPIERSFWQVSTDHPRDAGVLPGVRLQQGDFRWSDIRAAVFDGVHQSLAACAGAGNNLIVEHILDTPGWGDDPMRLPAPCDELFVGLPCDLDELQRREAIRGGRPLGSAEQHYLSVNKTCR
ncbi:MAG: chloramphenicol phosphotransferase [Pseudomonadota bacterium]